MDPHELSRSAEMLGIDEALAVAGRVRVEEEAAAVSDAGRWEKVPRRCISRETSLASYVLPVVVWESKSGVSSRSIQ